MLRWWGWRHAAKSLWACWCLLGPLGNVAASTPPRAVDPASRWLVDDQARLWEATLGNVWVSGGASKLHLTTRNGLPNDTITALAQDANGQVWLGTRNGLLVYDGATLQEISYAEGLPSK